MRVFIAGATGVLGRRMVQQFTEKNHDVVGLARDEKGSQAIRRFGGEAVFGNMFDAGSIAGTVKKADVTSLFTLRPRFRLKLKVALLTGQ